MNDEELKKILNDPKQLLELIRAVHRMLHLYDAKEMLSQQKPAPGGKETMGLKDQLEVRVIKRQTKSEEAKQ